MPKNDVSRITIDISTISHKKLKAMAAMQGKSMRQVVSDLIDEKVSKKSKSEEDCLYDHTPNKETIKAIENSQKGKNLVRAKDSKDLFKKLGI